MCQMLCSTVNFFSSLSVTNVKNGKSGFSVLPRINLAQSMKPCDAICSLHSSFELND